MGAQTHTVGHYPEAHAAARQQRPWRSENLDEAFLIHFLPTYDALLMVLLSSQGGWHLMQMERNGKLGSK
jgi:hypothetical protein